MNKPFRPMLSGKLDLTSLRLPGLVSPKLDGIRCLIHSKVAYSRTMKPIRNCFVQDYLRQFAVDGMDGELIVGEATNYNAMQATSSGVMSAAGIPDFTYHVFDLHNVDLPFQERYLHLQDLVAQSMHLANKRRIVVVPHMPVTNKEMLETYESVFLEGGYEGLMFRSLNGPYKQGRSTQREGYLLKMKRFEDSEAIVTGYQELLHNNNELEKDERGYAKRSHKQEGKVGTGVLGSLDVRDIQTGQSFNLGTGYTASTRHRLWQQRESLVGKIVTYKHFASAGVKDAPRLPVFKCFRDTIDFDRC